MEREKGKEVEQALDGNKVFDLGVYLVTDRPLALGRPLAYVVEAALAGGASVVQLREKNLNTRDFVQEAREIKKIVEKYGGTFIINDRLDVAQAVGAHGVHLGQEDMPLGLARVILGGEAVIGVSVSSPVEARRAARGGADYLGVSAIFSTPTKEEAPALGLEGLGEISRAVSLPLVAIGGIKADNAGEVIRAGAHGVAVVSEIMGALDPRAAAARLREAVTQGRDKGKNQKERGRERVEAGEPAGRCVDESANHLGKKNSVPGQYAQVKNRP